MKRAREAKSNSRSRHPRLSSFLTPVAGTSPSLYSRRDRKILLRHPQRLFTRYLFSFRPSSTGTTSYLTARSIKAEERERERERTSRVAQFRRIAARNYYVWRISKPACVALRNSRDAWPEIWPTTRMLRSRLFSKFCA